MMMMMVMMMIPQPRAPGAEAGAGPHLEEIGRLLGQLGSHELEVLLVELALEVAAHLVVVEGAVLAEGANELDPVGRAGGKLQPPPLVTRGGR